ncbi:sensor histidine kinase [Bradyrhizobium diazoefficiens]
MTERFLGHSSRTSIMLPQMIGVEAECNHRIANSLQIVASLISMDSQTLLDQDAKQSLEQAGRRIRAIAGVHRHLYALPSSEELDASHYLVALITDLESLCSGPRSTERLIYQIEPIRIDANVAISLGLILTEATINACKYAYGDGRRGNITIRLTENDDSSCRLEVSDEGIGFAPTRGARDCGGFGTRLISLAADRIGATYHYEHNRPGTHFILCFPKRACAFRLA